MCLHIATNGKTVLKVVVVKFSVPWMFLFYRSPSPAVTKPRKLEEDLAQVMLCFDDLQTLNHLRTVIALEEP
jgi:hypothetical protein